ncbi:hypothetical protein EX30DRAFT_395645, partial [Ascodesmis nigricans]
FRSRVLPLPPPDQGDQTHFHRLPPPGNAPQWPRRPADNDLRVTPRNTAPFNVPAECGGGGEEAEEPEGEAESPIASTANPWGYPGSEGAVSHRVCSVCGAGEAGERDVSVLYQVEEEEIEWKRN